MSYARPTVYLIAQPTVKRNGSMPKLEPLAEHGDVKVVIPAGEYPTFHPQRALDLVMDKLDDFDYTKDYIAWAGGDTLSAILVGAALAEKDDCTDEEEPVPIPYFMYLRYERGRDQQGNRTDVGAKYVPVKIPLFPSGENPLLTVPSHDGVIDDND